MSIRLVAGILWFLAGCYLGSFAAYQFGLSDLLAPLTGVLGVALFAGDPFEVIWKPARHRAESARGAVVASALDS